MNDKEIEEIIIEHYGSPVDGMMPMAGALVSAAYEKSAQMAETIAGRDANPHSRETSRQIAAYIRTLKDAAAINAPAK